MALPLNWRRPWRELDDQELTLRVSRGESSSNIASAMHRTKFAIQARADKLGLGLSQSKRPWRNKSLPGRTVK